MKRMKSVANDGFHGKVPSVHTGDEIETFFTTFSVTVDSLNKYIGEISSVLGAIANGNFTVKTKQDHKGDFAAIKDAINSISASLSRMFCDVYDSADKVG